MNPAEPTMHLDPAALCGLNDHPHFATGWHERECDERCGIAYRAAGATATLLLRRETNARRVCLLLSGPRGLCEGPLRGALEADGRSREIELNADVWTTRELELDSGQAGAKLRVTLTASNPVMPDRVLHNGDGRLLGWFVSAAWQE